MFIMKNYLHFSIVAAVVAVAFLATSCGSSYEYFTLQKKTPVASCDIHTSVVADLEISPKRISFSIVPPEENKYKEDICKALCMRAALAANDSAEVLVDPQFTVDRKASKDQYNQTREREITKVTITGYPAKYKNIRSVATPYENINRSYDYDKETSSTNSTNNTNSTQSPSLLGIMTLGLLP